jgi:hypothetical protein
VTKSVRAPLKQEKLLFKLLGVSYAIEAHHHEYPASWVLRCERVRLGSSQLSLIMNTFEQVLFRQLKFGTHTK